MPKKFASKDVKLKKGAIEKGNLHPNSRKAQQLQRTLLRQNRQKEKQSQQLLNKWGLLIDRILWFQMLALEIPLALEEIHEIISNKYLKRFTEELQEIEAQQKSSLHSKPKSTRQHQIEFILEKEKDEYQKGAFELPDFTQKDQIEALNNWQGDVSSMGKFKMLNFCQQKS